MTQAPGTAKASLAARKQTPRTTETVLASPRGGESWVNLVGEPAPWGWAATGVWVI